MVDRYCVISRDWQRFDRPYVVWDNQSNKWVLQTIDLGRAIAYRDELNADGLAETRAQLDELAQQAEGSHRQHMEGDNG